MKPWKWLALLLLVLGVHSFASDYYYERFSADGVLLIYADLIRDFVCLAFALSGHVIALVFYAVYMLIFSLIPTLSYAPDYPHLAALVRPEIMSAIKFASCFIYAIFFFFLGKEIASLVRMRSWGRSINTGEDSWLRFSIKNAWIILFPLAYVVEMHSYRGLFADYLLSVVGIWPVLLIGGFMLCVFAGIRLFFLLGALALLGTVVNLIALIFVHDVPITDWPQLTFRLGAPILAAISLFMAWRDRGKKRIG